MLGGLRMQLAPKLSDELGDIPRKQFCPFHPRMAAGAERQHQRELRDTRLPMVNDQQTPLLLGAGREAAGPATMAISLEDRFAEAGVVAFIPLVPRIARQALPRRIQRGFPTAAEEHPLAEGTDVCSLLP